MNFDEYDKLSIPEKAAILMKEGLDLGKEIADEIIQNHREFAATLALMGCMGGDRLAFPVWEEYFKRIGNNFESIAIYSLFLRYIDHQAQKERIVEDFKRELEEL
jgi:hypothetical protein